MEIKGPGRVTPSGTSRKVKTRGSGKTAFSKELSTDESSAAAPLSGTSPLTSVSSLLALQEMPTSSEGRSAGLAMAEDMLGHLEVIRHGLLAGEIPQRKLKEVVAIVSQQRLISKDPALDEILNDIELRVKVELAKLEMLGGER
ncbi:MAG: flagellar assembly protein FliX [Alphaproteobacteria bacterium]|nr:MAG: flagellar assembly protein FliX [Alphaproteobacteria bacterium]